MDPDVLERFVIDRDAGELSADVAALLDAYLAGSPNDARAAERVQDTLSRARRALADRGDMTAVQPVPPLDRVRIERALSRPSRANAYAWFRRSAIAAAVFVSFVAGTRVSTRDNRIGSPGVSYVGGRPMIGSESSANGGFWSIRRFRPSSSVSKIDSGPRIRWESPIVIPQPGAPS